MNINRSNIIRDLFHFSQQGNGVLIGKPGIGKSYCLADLAEMLTHRNIPVAFLSIDTLPNGTDQSIEAVIESDGDWISYLDQIKLGDGEKAVLIFDAFDAARDDELRKQILFQISKAILKLKKWNILVSVRSYDATKSPQLLRLFGNSNSSNKIQSRHFEISELTDIELESVFIQNPALKVLYYTAGSELKRILRIPYFLRLLELVIENDNPVKIDELKLIKSETELLDKFWDKKVANTENSYKKETCLKVIANKLVENKSLSILKDEFIKDQVTFKELRSDDIINEVGVNNNYVSFSHNILFDYIVGRLVIPSEPEKLLEFIVTDKSRPFFLRPSFIFHFTSLWFYHRDLFWANFNYFQTQTDKNLLLFRRLIQTSVIANEFENVSNLESILGKREIVQQLLQSIRFLSARNIGQRDLELLYSLSDKLEIQFLWDYAFIFDRILESEIFKSRIYQEKCGIISRRFLRYILDERKAIPERKQSLDRLGSTKVIEFVSKTFNSNIEQSKVLLREVLDLLKEINFEIWYFSSLSDDLKYFVEESPEFVAEIYNTIFSHTELSEEKTNMGTVTLNLISNRRQDFEMCYYRLGLYFPSFIASSPEIAIKTGLKIVNSYIKENKIYISEKRNIITYPIKIIGISCSFIPDFSSIWHASLSYDKPAQLIENIIDYFKQLVVEDKTTNLKSYVELYISNAEVGFTWKKLIEFGNEYPEILKEYLFQLGLNQIILDCDDTTYEIGLSLQKIFPLLDEPQRKQLEETILEFLYNDNKEEQEFAQLTVNRLLNCIPRDFLSNEISLNIIDNQIPKKNEPTFKSSWSSEPFTTDKWLAEQGVDLKSETNKDIYDKISSLENFNRERMNDQPFRQDFINLLPIVEYLYKQVSTLGVYEKAIEFSALTEVAKFYSIVSRDKSQIDEEDYKNAKKAVQYCLSYISKHDESYNEKSSPAHGYSPTPRIEASSALIGLFSFKKDDTIFEEIKNTVVDNNPIVRFNVLRNIALLWSDKQNEYWEIVLERLANEPDSFTIATVINNIFRNKIIDNKKNVTQAIEIAAKRVKEFGKRDSFIEAFSKLLLFLLDKKKNEIARKIINDNIENTNFIQTLVFKLFDFIDPKFRDNDYSIESTRKELIELFQDIASKNLSRLKNDDPVKFSQEGSPERDRLLLIDFIVQRIYFGLDINVRIRNKLELYPSEKNKRDFYTRIKPILLNIVKSSKEIGGGIMIGHTAHFLIETLNGVIKIYPEEARSILDMTFQITELAFKTGYTFDPSSIKEVVNLTETLFADHKELLREDENLNRLIFILNFYVESGWPQALELLWKLDEAFK